MKRYVITTHAHMPGARLSKVGNWGNLQFDDTAAAERAARKDAGDGPISIEHETVARRRTPA